MWGLLVQIGNAASAAHEGPYSFQSTWEQQDNTPDADWATWTLQESVEIDPDWATWEAL